MDFPTMNFPTINFPTRKISDFELSDRLRAAERLGAEVPMLRFSINSPQYVETKKDGMEIYNHGGIFVEVRSGQVIDSHGNVVDLARLEAQAFQRMFQPTSMGTPSPTEDKYIDLTLITPLRSLNDPREITADKYADLF